MLCRFVAAAFFNFSAHYVQRKATFSSGDKPTSNTREARRRPCLAKVPHARSGLCACCGFHFGTRSEINLQALEPQSRCLNFLRKGEFQETFMTADRMSRYWPETLSIVRIVIALLFLEHGSAKLFGFPTPPHGVPAVMTLLWLQGVIEFVGGVLLAMGLFTRPAAFILTGDMAVAYFMAHASKNFFPLLNGGDGAILYCFMFLLFFVAGPGRWSIDSQVDHNARAIELDYDHHRTVHAVR
jgi:putative oxidoreductase